MKRLLAATALAAAALAPATAHAARSPHTCTDPVDVHCQAPCTYELDCGMNPEPPCVLWAYGNCVVG